MSNSLFDPLNSIALAGAVFSLTGVYRFYRLVRRNVPAPSLLDRNVEDWPQTEKSEGSATDSNIERNAW